MPPRPEPLHQPTTDIALENLSESGRKDISALDEADATSRLLSTSIRNTPETKGEPPLRASTYDMLLLAGIFVMLVWPWIFLGIVWAWRGVQMHNSVAKVVINHPQSTSFFVTLIGIIVSIIVSALFSRAVIHFAQQWVTINDHVTVFDVSLISAFRNQNWPWSIKDHKYLLVRDRWSSVVLAGAFLVAFALVPPGTTSLIAPVSFHRTLPLTGTEVDFSSRAADCLEWIITTSNANICGWKTLNGVRYFSCLEGPQLVDVLESGRSNIQALLSNKSESFVLSQLGSNSALRFVGPTRGVLPIGPNGLTGFDRLQPSLLSDAQTKAVILSYNYTLDHQGLTSNIRCIYDTQSPIRFWPMVNNVNNTNTLLFNGTCDSGLADGFKNGTAFEMPNVTKCLAFWGCTSLSAGQDEPVYYLYLRGCVHYATSIGNITCTISQMQPAVFPVTYQSGTGVFSTKEQIATSEPGQIFTEFFKTALIGLVDALWEGQIVTGNLVADSIMNLGIQSLGLPADERNEGYLPLYAAMIEGILVNQAVYMRFLILTAPNPPASCLRTVNGSLSAEVIGWVAKPVHIGFLLPMTILNLASLVVIRNVISRAKRGSHQFDPTDPRPLALAEPSLHLGDPSGWADGVRYRSREWLKENVSHTTPE